MPFRLSKRQARGGGATVLGTYVFSSHTVQVLRTGGEHIEWTCDCDRFQRQGQRGTPLWCKHIAKAAARRSLERLTARRIGRISAEGPPLRVCLPETQPPALLPSAAPGAILSARLVASATAPRLIDEPGKVAPGGLVTPR